jgi:hypothetical protein
MGDVTLNSLSVTNISAGHISLSSLNAYYLLAQAISVPIDGSYIVPQTLTYDRFALNGDLILNSGNWLHGGQMAISSFSTITRINASSFWGDDIRVTKASFGNVETATLSSVYISTGYMDMSNMDFVRGRGFFLSVGSLSVGTAQFSSLNFTNFYASSVGFSSFVGDSGTLSNITVSSVTFHDPVYLTENVLRLAGGNLLLDNVNILSNAALSSQLISTTGGLQDLNTATSNYLAGSIGSFCNAFGITVSSLSTTSASNLSSLQEGLSTGLSTLSTSVGLALNTLSTATGWNFSTSRNLISTLEFSASSISSGFVATENLSATVAKLNTLYVSTMSSKFGYFEVLSAATLYADVVSTSITQDIVQLNVDELFVSTAYMSSIYSISSFAREFHASTGHFLYVSTDYLQAPILSTLSANTGSNFINLSGTVTAAFVSTNQHLGSLGYVSSTWFNSTIEGLGTLGYVSEGIVRSNLTSTVVGLGTAGYVSTPTLDSALTSTSIGLGSLGFVSSASLTSSMIHMGNLGFLSVAVNCNDLTSTVQGLAQIGYLSTIPSNISTSAITASSISLSTVIAQELFVFSSLSTFGFRAYGNTSSHVEYLLKVSSLTVSNRIEANQIRGFTNGLDFLFLAGTAAQSGTTIRYSPNGEEWFNSAGTFTGEAYSFAVGPSLAIAAGSNLVGSTYLKYSTDGISWNSVPGSNVDQPVNYVFYADGRYYASAANSEMYYSDDGLTWNNASGGFSVKGNGFAYAADLDILVVGGQTTSGSNIKWSDDRGATWNNQTAGVAFTNPVKQVAYDNDGLFLAASGGRTYPSFDGKEWLDLSGAVDIFTTINGVIYSGDRWIAFGTGTPSIQYSFDGYDWFDNATGTFTTTTVSVAYGNGRYVALGSSGGAYSIKYSFDGITWSNASINVPTSVGYGVNALQFPSTETPVYFYTISSQVANISSLTASEVGVVNLEANTLEVYDTLSTQALFFSTAIGDYLTVSSITLHSTIYIQDDQYPGNYSNLHLSNGDLYLNNQVIGGGAGGGVTANQVTSTTQGLGLLGYISSLSLQSSIVSTTEGLGTYGYISSLSLQSSIVSTTEGLGTYGYISSLSLQSTIEGLGNVGYVSTLDLVSTTNSLFTSLTSTTQGLGTLGYLSTGGGTGDVTTANLVSTVTGLGTAGYLSTGGGGGPLGPELFTSSIFASTLTIDFIHGKLIQGSNGSNSNAVGNLMAFGLPATGSLRTIKLGADAGSWTDSGPAFTQEADGGVYNDSLFWAIGANSGNDQKVLKSVDQITWTYSLQDQAVALAPQKIYAALNKTWVVGIADDAGEEAIWYRTNGQNTWQSIATRNPVQTAATSMAFSNTFIVVGGSNLTAGSPGSNFIYSTDGGATFNPQQSGTLVDQINDLIYVSSQGKFFAAGTQGTNTQLFTSADGMNWTAAQTVNNFILFRLKYLESKFFALGYNATSATHMFSSPDFTNWAPSANNGFTAFALDIVYDATTTSYIACGSNTTSGSTPIKYSSDGLNWNDVNPPGPSQYAPAYISLYIPPASAGQLVESPVFFSTISAASIYTSSFVARNASIIEIGTRDITTLSTFTFVDQTDLSHTAPMWWKGDKLFVSSVASPVILRQDLLSICAVLNTWAGAQSPPLTPPF